MFLTYQTFPLEILPALLLNQHHLYAQNPVPLTAIDEEWAMWALSNDGKRTSSESQIQSNDKALSYYVSTKPFARAESATGMRNVRN